MVLVKCDGCSQGLRHCKLLCCLHVVCLSCLEDHLDGDNTVTCPCCEADTTVPTGRGDPIHSLPDATLGKTAAGANDDDAAASLATAAALTGEDSAASSASHATESQALCEECMDEEPATVMCSDCQSALCEVHAKAHGRSKRTWRHKLESIREAAASSGGKSSASATRFCPLHKKKALTSYCEPCRVLLCERCAAAKTHENHGDNITETSQAAASERTQLSKLLCDDSEGSECLETLVVAAVDVARTAIQNTDDSIEAVSNEVVEFFGVLERQLQSRRDDLLDQLDKIRWSRQDLLEKQISVLNESQRQVSQATDLLANCSEDCNLLLMAPWLNAAAVRCKAGLLSVPNSQPVFKAQNKEKIEAVVGNLGHVADASVIPDENRPGGSASTGQKGGPRGDNAQRSESEDEYCGLDVDSEDYGGGGLFGDEDDDFDDW
eukprot:scpid91500/ scgid24877/ 